MKKDLLSMNMEDMRNAFKELALPFFRAKQVFRHIHKKGIIHFDEMTDLSKDLRELLKEHFYITSCSVIKQNVGSATVKSLLQYKDGETVETALMMYKNRKDQKDRHTLCVSTQVGCAMGCAFCATGISKFARNLTTGEILAQVWAANRCLETSNVTNVVFMGMGEPLANYDAVLKAIKLLNEPEGLNISTRRITLSTSGLVPQIRQLAKERLGIVLAISLHAPNDELRSALMPINRKYPLKELLSAVDEYIKITAKRVTFEYILLSGINDMPEHALKLAELVKGKLINVNLIPYNDIKEAPYRRPTPKRINLFRKILVENGVEAVIREEMGSEIDAACGQLRRRTLFDRQESN